MNNLNKLWGFRTNKTWKKVLACIYYLFCLIFITLTLFDKPEIQMSIYDLIIYKISTIMMSSSYLIPVILLSDFKFKEKIPLIKRKKWWSDLIGYIIFFIIIVCLSNIVTLFHTNTFKINYENYIKTEIIYQSVESDEVPENEKSNLTSDELVQDYEKLENDKNNDKIESQEEYNKNQSIENISQNKKIKIHYIDVDQGDSIFIELPNEETMLIDAGEASKGTIVENYIKKLGYTKIDYLIGTHPHTDHIGGLSYIIENFKIGKIYMPKAVSTSKTYENLLNTISEKGLKITTAKAGVNIIDINDLKIDIISPTKDSYNNLNNYSAVIKINYKNNKFLFMGDAESTVENEILEDVSADVIKIGHHGSNTSSSNPFISKVKAKYAIIMVGLNNRYNHPNQDTIDKWEKSGATIYRTDLNGNITVTSDGDEINIDTTK